MHTNHTCITCLNQLDHANSLNILTYSIVQTKHTCIIIPQTMQTESTCLHVTCLTMQTEPTYISQLNMYLTMETESTCINIPNHENSAYMIVYPYLIR